MRKFPFLLASAMSVAAATAASAQTAAGVPPAPGKFTISINGAFQVGGHDVTRSNAFPLYEEEATVDVTQTDIGGGALFDIGANMRIRGNFGAGVSYNFVSSKGDGTVNGLIPHPEVFDNPRPISASASDLKHEENAVHVYATWYVPFTDKVDFTVSAGPSFFNVKQDFIQTVFFSENPPSFDQVTVDEVVLTSLKENAVGFNVGVDANYAITRMFGAGVMIRYTWAEPDFTVNEGDTVGIPAGGFQIGGGLRVRF